MRCIWKVSTVCEYFCRSAEIISRMRTAFLIYWQATDANTRKAGSVYILLYVLKIFKMIQHPTNCEIWSLIRFLNARNVKLADIRQICKVYGENTMSDGMVRKWVKKFNEGRDNVRDEPWSDRPSVVSNVFIGGHVI
jgi:hypothetical protein